MPELPRRKIVRLSTKLKTKEPPPKKKKKRYLKGGPASAMQQNARVTPVFKADGFDELEAWADKRLAKLRKQGKLPVEEAFLAKMDMDAKLKLLGVRVHRHIYVTVDLPEEKRKRDKDGPVAANKALIEMVKDEEGDLQYWLESRWTKGGRINESSTHDTATEALNAAYELNHNED